jgi:hypothetical protein
LSEPSSIPHELEAIEPHVYAPVQPLIAECFTPFAMFADFALFPWMLKLSRYASLNDPIASREANVIVPTEAKSNEILRLRQTYDPDRG